MDKKDEKIKNNKIKYFLEKINYPGINRLWLVLLSILILCLFNKLWNYPYFIYEYNYYDVLLKVIFIIWIISTILSLILITIFVLNYWKSK